MNEKKKFDVKNAIVWVLTVMISLSIIFMGNKIVMKDAQIFMSSDNETVRGEVVEVIDSVSDVMDLGNDTVLENTWVGFKCEIKNGDEAGTVVDAIQTIDGMYAGSQYVRQVEVGDQVMIISSDNEFSNLPTWQFSDYYRMDKIYILAGIFFWQSFL